MPTDTELRDLLGPGDAPNRLDARAIVTRSRARRRPRQALIGTIGALAVAGVSVLAVQVSQVPFVSSTSMLAEAPATDSDAGSMESFADGTQSQRAPAERLNLCAGTLAEVVPGRSGLQLSVEFPPTATIADGFVTGTVVMTNTGTTRVTGSTPASPAITLSQDGVVLWHSNGPMIMSLAIVDLAPGESLEYTASFMPVSCGVEDDLADAFPADLSSVQPGTYDLSAAIDFTDDSTGVADLVSGPRSSIVLR